MWRPALIATVAALGLSHGIVAQHAKQPPGTPGLELNLEARDIVRGVPTTFHIILRNIGAEDIRLPEPSLGCASASSGAVLLVEKHTPKLPGVDDLLTHACKADLPYNQDIRKQMKSWVLLRPGGYLERVASPGRMHYENHGGGTYDLFVEYTPPVLAPDERRALTQAGYLYPQTRLVSKHLVLRKDR